MDTQSDKKMNIIQVVEIHAMSVESSRTTTTMKSNKRSTMPAAPSAKPKHDGGSSESSCRCVSVIIVVLPKMAPRGQITQSLKTQDTVRADLSCEWWNESVLDPDPDHVLRAKTERRHSCHPGPPRAAGAQAGH
jgi:hypothetical protein